MQQQNENEVKRLNRILGTEGSPNIHWKEYHGKILKSAFFHFLFTTYFHWNLRNLIFNVTAWLEYYSE